MTFLMPNTFVVEDEVAWLVLPLGETTTTSSLIYFF